jgi:hypothetical protein
MLETIFGRTIHWQRLGRFNALLLFAWATYFARRSGLFRIYLAGWVIMIVLALLRVAVRALRRRAIASGPSVAGTVRFTKIHEDRFSLLQRYVLIISYKYYLQNEPYWGSKVRRFPSELEAGGAAAGLCETAVMVHYDPRHPDRSMLA